MNQEFLHLSAPSGPWRHTLLCICRPRKRNSSFRTDLSLWDWTCLSSGYHCRMCRYIQPIKKEHHLLDQVSEDRQKTAQQMVLDLEGKTQSWSKMYRLSPKPKDEEESSLEEAMEAMLALGYKATELKKIEILRRNDIKQRTISNLRCWWNRRFLCRNAVKTGSKWPMHLYVAYCMMKNRVGPSMMTRRFWGVCMELSNT